MIKENDSQINKKITRRNLLRGNLSQKLNTDTEIEISSSIETALNMPVSRRETLKFAGAAVGLSAIGFNPILEGNTDKKQKEEVLSESFDQFNKNLNNFGLRLDIETGRLDVAGDWKEVIENRSLSAEEKSKLLTQKAKKSLEESGEDEHSKRDLAIAFAGSALAIGTMLDLMKRGRVGVRDFGAMTAANIAAATAGSEGFRHKVEKNLEETAVSMAKIEVITIMSSKIVQIKGDIPKPVEEDITSSEEHVLEIEEEIEEIAPSITLTPEAEDEIREYVHGQHDKRKALRDVIWGANLLGPVGSTFASSAMMRPLLMELATDADGNIDKDMAGTLQGWIPNYLGLVAVTPIGGGIGPRAAIQTLKGEEFLKKLDKQLVPYYLASNLGFAGEVLYRMTPEERGGSLPKAYASFVTKDMPNLMWVRDVYKRGFQFEAKGHLIRGRDHLQDFAPEFVEDLKNLPKEIFSSSSPAEAYGKLSELDNKLYEGVRETVGHEVGEIAYVLSLQSLGIPHMEVSMSWVLENMKKYIPKNVSEEAKEEIIDALTYTLVAGMSSTFDNYVAVNIAQRVLDTRLKNHIEDGRSGKPSRGIVDSETGEVNLGELRKRHMNYALIGYVAGQFGGSILPPGNMANIAEFSLREYSMQDAIKPNRLIARSIPNIAGFAVIKTIGKLGLVQELPDPKFEEEQGIRR